MITFAWIFGAENDRAKREMKEALDFELKLIKVSKYMFNGSPIDLLLVLIAQ